MTFNPTLWRAYQTATFEVLLPDRTITLHPNARHRELDRLLAKHEAQSWAIVTAFNPGSERLPPAENEVRNGILYTDCMTRGYKVIAARGGSSDWGWEASLLLLDIDRKGAIELGRRYGQNAILFGRRDEAALLLSCQGMSHLLEEPQA
ncbi:DUF3293 domain-containing protein [Pelagibius sp. Alg239-R121]|uniref:DUF3293 domain-containing protein n=1 Tax=Pelagibius sp. Alg239-R121 TaxID=2993448 RepID=UPI0024A70A4B|nr:DUF3293 domain-containing protein [Pelagibius sp. Alg239-R121]